MAAIKIVWWSQEWDIGELRGSYHAGTGPLLNGGPESVARRFTTLLEECKSLQMVEVLIPNRSGLSKSFFKPKLFDSCCEMLQLRRLKAHIPKLTIHTGNEPLYKWLEEPMMVERERHDDKEDGLRKRPRV
ncbi:hypothetical protein BU16DRAFT_521794 [Lophium mytilinum]|uniref:Uncharacterized protein n=1 Tax=Lophium mytilinum TaxID=390894 RepID=A0A6A6REC1_9PEZI|nr:hypothetical protein BU16DRAFT_521794 [Lophium mytilinum]